MALSDRLLEELHRALRTRNVLRVSTICLARAAIHNAAIERGRDLRVLMPKVKHRADGALVSRLTRQARGDRA